MKGFSIHNNKTFFCEITLSRSSCYTTDPPGTGCYLLGVGENRGVALGRGVAEGRKVALGRNVMVGVRVMVGVGVKVAVGFNMPLGV